MRKSRAIRAWERPIAAASTISARSRSRQAVLVPRMRFVSTLRPAAVKVTSTAGSGMRGSRTGLHRRHPLPRGIVTAARAVARHNEAHGRHPRVHPQLGRPAAPGPRGTALATAPPGPGHQPGRVRLCHRDPPRRRADSAVPAALRRLSPFLRVRDLLRRPAHPNKPSTPPAQSTSQALDTNPRRINGATHLSRHNRTLAPASASGTLAHGISFQRVGRLPPGARRPPHDAEDEHRPAEQREGEENNGTKKTSGMNRAHGVNVISQDTTVTAAAGPAMKQTAELSIVTTGLSGPLGVPGPPPRGITSRGWRRHDRSGVSSRISCHRASFGDRNRVGNREGVTRGRDLPAFFNSACRQPRRPFRGPRWAMKSREPSGS
jgi:hypothetical protein